MRRKKPPLLREGITVLTCTKRPECMHALFRNFARQHYKNKELIVILNHRTQRLSDYLAAAKPYKNIRIYRLPERVSLGRCLNYGVKAAKYGVIAKFDDDDYYAPHYLTESMRTLKGTGADIVGKRAYFMYLRGRRLLLLRYPGMDNRYVSYVAGATLLFKRHVFRKVAFPNQSLGECVKFCSRSRAKGFKVYAGSKHNFVAIRRKNSQGHTWAISDRALLTGKVKVLRVRSLTKTIIR
ncbi:glycosyltransferase [Gorillibacterium timonense]|uniref:glycosyltransferase n=1 Tax=Gorillibacterium timonense TaxID=1689269 RepID=UPI00071CE7B4|nr:glycosyltransferase [Gorillibacterium timonense]